MPARAVRVWSWDPAATAMNAVEVVRYAYDDQGRLREAWARAWRNPSQPFTSTTPRVG